MTTPEPPEVGALELTALFRSDNPEHNAVLARTKGGAVIHLVSMAEVEKAEETVPYLTLSAAQWASAVGQAKATGAHL
jgi:hypothetical protein